MLLLPINVYTFRSINLGRLGWWYTFFRSWENINNRNLLYGKLLLTCVYIFLPFYMVNMYTDIKEKKPRIKGDSMLTFHYILAVVFICCRK